MSQLVISFEVMDQDQLRNLLDFWGRAEFIRQIAKVGEVSNEDLLFNLRAILGDEGVEELEKAREAFESGSSTQSIFERQGPDPREALARELEKRGSWASAYAQALRGFVSSPSQGIKILLAMLRDSRIESKHKTKGDPNSAVRLALDSAFNVQAAELKARQEQAKAELQARQERAAVEVENLESAFRTHCSRKDIWSMQETLKALHDAYLQAALIKKLGGVENRNYYFDACQGAIDRAIFEEANR